jgi:two-component system, cell cycle sensor histidine kinase and response regulator CckA
MRFVPSACEPVHRSSEEFEMRDEDKSKEQLITELKALRQRVAESEKDEAECKRAEDALLESEIKFKSFAEYALAGIYLIQDGVFKYVNPKFAQMFGYTVEECLNNMPFKNLVYTEDLTKVEERIRRRTSGEVEFVRHTFRGLKKNGQSFHVEVYGSTIVYKGKPAATGTILDITVRKQVEEFTRLRLALLEFSGSHSLEELIQKTMDEVCASTNSPIGFYFFVESDQTTISLQAWSTRTLKEFCKAAWKGAHYPIEKAGVWADCVRERRPVIHNDYPALPHRKGMPEGHAEVIRELSVPIMRSGRVVAILGIGNKPANYTENDVEIVSYLADVAWEITERKRAEDALRLNERRLRRAEVVARFGNWELIRGCNKVKASEGARIIYGMEGSEWAIAEVQRTPLPEYRGMLDKALNGLIEEGKPYNVEFKIRRPTDGKIIDIHSIAEYSSEKGVVFGVLQDISERKQAEEALQQSEQNYREIFNTANDAIFVHDADTGTVLDVNDSMSHLYGFSREEALRLSPNDSSLGTSPYSAAEVRQWMARAIEEGPQVFEWHARKKSGELFWVEVALKSANISGQRRMLAIVRDITDRKRAEEERKKLEEQLFQSQKMESVGRLAGGVAHDFNNMLGVIIGRAEMALKQDVSTDGVRHNLQEILKAGLRSADLTRQLLAFARKQTAMPKILDLNDTISGMIKMLRRLIAEDIKLSWQPGLDLWRVKMDPSQVDQILANLVVNAHDAISGTGAVTLITENVVMDDSNRAKTPEFIPGEYVRLTVSDTGAGMSQEVRENIFEPFFTTKEVGKGTGLGLSTVYGIVKQNDGFIYVVSEPGKGTTFKVYLPRFDTETAQIPSEQITGKRLTGTETILLVEDDEAILNLGKMILENLGYTVLAAHTPVYALHLVEEHPGDIHLLITDVVMPEMNGRELAEKLRVIRPNLKCLYMSGYTADVIAHRGILDEGVNFIQKPFGSDAIAARVRQVLDRLE